MSTPQTTTIGDGLVRTRNAGVNLAFRVQGAGPAVVLLHGTSANHAVWTDVAEALADRAQVISIDQRGHGRSDKPDTGYGADDFAGDVVSILDAVGVDRALVAGHSLGGRNAWVTAALHPERVTGAVVVDYTPYVESTVLDELDVRVAAGFRSFADVEEIETYLRSRYALVLDEAVRRRARWGYRQSEDGTWVPYASPVAMRELIAGFRTPWDAEFRAVSVPMTHLRGEHSGIVSPAAWERAQRDRPADRWVQLPGLDHYIPEERPDLVADEIAALLPRN